MSNDTLIIPTEIRDKMSVEMARLYYDEVQAYKNGLLLTISKTRERGYTLFAASLTIATAAGAWQQHGGGLPALIIHITTLVVAFMLMIGVLGAYTYHTEGSAPHELGIAKFVEYYRIESGYGETRTLVHLICDQIECLNQDILCCERVSSEVSSWYGWCLNAYLLGVILTIASFTFS